VSEEDVTLSGTHLPWGKVKITACTRCGAEIVTLGDICKACVTRDIRKEMLRRQSAILIEMPDDFEMRVGRDKGKARHIGMIGNIRLALCGTEITEAKKNHTWHPVNKLPDMALVCDACKSVLQQARKGGYK